MQQKGTESRTPNWIIALIYLIVFLILAVLSAFLIFDFVNKRQGSFTDFLTLVLGAVTVYASFLSALTLFFLQRQVIALRQQLELQRRDASEREITQLFDELVTANFREKLKLVYSHESEDLKLSSNLMKIKPELRQAVEEVTARLDGLGFRVRLQHNAPTKEQTLLLFWDIVIRAAQKFFPHIIEQRQARGEEAPENMNKYKLPNDLKYKYDFEWLAIECKCFQLRKGHYGLALPDSEDLNDWLGIQPLCYINQKNRNPEDDLTLGQ